MVGERFSSVLSKLNLSTKYIVDKYNITQQYVSVLKKTEKINDTLASICVDLNVNLNWLLTGKGEMFVNDIPSYQLYSDAKIAEKILDDLISFFDGKKESLVLSKRIFFSINSNTKKFAYLLDELLEKIDDSQYQKKDIISILDKDLSFFTKITSIVEIKMLKEFIETLDQETLSFMCQNKKAVQLVIKASFSSMDYAINKAITK